MTWQSLKRDYVSPVGQVGALLGLLIFSFSCLAIFVSTADIWWVTVGTASLRHGL